MNQVPAITGYEDILEQKKLEMKTVVSELFAMCRSQTSLGPFLQQLLVFSIRLIEGVGGSIWVKQGGKTELVFDTGESRDLLTVVEGNLREEDVLQQIAQIMKPYVATLRRNGMDEETQSGYIGLYIPIEADGGLLGILKVVVHRESKVIYKEDVELLQNMVGLVSIYMNQLHIPKVLGRMEEIGKLFEINREIFSSLDQTQIAFTLVNLLPGVIQCERCSVGLYDGTKLKVAAITGQDEIEQKSVMIKSLASILEEAGKGDAAVNLNHEEIEGMEDGILKDAGEEYFHAHPFKALYAVQIKDKDRLFGVLIIETTQESSFSQTDINFLQFVSAQTAIALKNARLFQGIPLSGTWQRLFKWSERLGLTPWTKKITITLAVIAIVLVPFLVPVENDIRGQSEILPIYRYYARAKTDGILKSFQIQEGSRVEKGDIVATLDDEPLQKSLREAQTKKEVSQANITKYFGLGQMADYEIERYKLKELEVEIEFIQSEIERTKIIAEGPGVVITPQPRFWERIGKPVAKGEELIEIGDLDRLRLEVAIDEKDIQFINPGQTICFLLNSLPEKSFEVKAKVIRERAEVRETGNYFILEADLDSIEGPLRPGMKGEAKVYAGKAPLGKVYLREMIEWFRMKIFKWF